MDDDVSRTDDGGLLVRSDAEVRIAVERRGIQSTIDRHFRTHLDLRREPVLPAETGLDVTGLYTGALSLLVVEPLQAIRDVVQLRRAVVHIGQERLHRGRARQLGRVAAMCAERRIPRHHVERERRSARDESDRGRVVEIENVVLVLVVGLERDVPLVVELVIVGQPVPLKVIVAPGAVVDPVRDDVDAVIAAVGDVTNAGTEGGLRARILQHGRVRETTDWGSRLRSWRPHARASLPFPPRRCPGPSSSC